MIERDNMSSIAEFKIKWKAEQVEEISQFIRTLDEIGYWESSEPKDIEISDWGRK